jgi:hypothetical protein
MLVTWSNVSAFFLFKDKGPPLSPLQESLFKAEAQSMLGVTWILAPAAYVRRQAGVGTIFTCNYLLFNNLFPQTSFLQSL